MTDQGTPGDSGIPHEGTGRRVARGALQIAGGAVPVVGGVLSAIAGAWSENEQAKVNRFFEQWVKMLEEEIREKDEKCLEIPKQRHHARSAVKPKA